MKALTICQPWAHLIAQPDGWEHNIFGPAKRVENRTWPTPYRGPLAIHAGKGRQHITPEDLAEFPAMAFGALVAVAELVDCVQLLGEDGMQMARRVPEWAQAKWPWLAEHMHTEGPWVWILANVRPLAVAVPCRGAQRLWTVPAALVGMIVENDAT